MGRPPSYGVTRRDNLYISFVFTNKPTRRQASSAPSGLFCHKMNNSITFYGALFLPEPSLREENKYFTTTFGERPPASRGYHIQECELFAWSPLKIWLWSLPYAVPGIFIYIGSERNAFDLQAKEDDAPSRQKSKRQWCISLILEWSDSSLLSTRVVDLLIADI